MTASTISRASVARPALGDRFAGLRPLLAKDVTEWLRGRRAWVVLVVVTLFMTITAANGWINATIASQLPDDADLGPYSLVPIDNLLAAVGAQMFILAAIFAVASLLASERQAGTLAWVASKPVSREAIWTSKWLSASAMLALTAALVPLAATVAVVVVLYGAPPMGAVVGLAIGMVAVVTFFAAVGLAAGTVLTAQPAIVAIGVAVLALTPIVAALIPFDVSSLLPMSMLTWAAMLATGAPAPLITPVAWAVATGGLIAFSAWRMRRLEP